MPSRDPMARDYQPPSRSQPAAPAPRAQPQRFSGAAPMANAPNKIRHQGRDFYATGKTGTASDSGLPSKEYQDGDSGHRVWLRADGSVRDE